MKKILLVEDDPILQKLYKEKLQLGGFEVSTASEGESGLETAKSTLPDFIILDLMIPKINGAEILQQLKLDNTTKDIPVGILTVIHPDLSNLSKELMEKVQFYWLKDSVNPKDVLADIQKRLGV